MSGPRTAGAEGGGARGGRRRASARRIRVLGGREAAAWVARGPGGGDDVALARTVAGILERVRREGDAAVLELGERLDGVRPSSLRVPPQRCAAALAALAPELLAALERAKRNLERLHAAARRRERAVETEPGVRAWREFRPIERVGAYAPGGRAPYPSSVLMAAVPARLAGCSEVVVCSPPGPGGEPAAAVLAAAALAGVDEVYAVGGAQAIAALAFGTETIRPVDKIFGPGGPAVNEAKLQAFRRVAVDLPAGPSEVVVWADAGATPAWIAAELLAQAEHGPDSLCVAVVEDARQGALVARLAGERLAAGAKTWTKTRTRAAAASLARSAVLVANGPEEALAWVNELAAEHVVLLRRDARERLAAVRHAGAVFLGPCAPVAAGDYASGTNHVLPTGRRARGCGGLSLDDFGRWMQVQEMDRAALARLAPTIGTLAEWEGFGAHAESVRVRLAEPAAAHGPAEEPDGAAPARPHLREVRAYATARAESRADGGGVRLDANENALGTLAPEVDPALHRYPDPECGELRAALARQLGAAAGRLWIGNGSDEAIDVLIRTVVEPGETVVVPSPTYGVYGIRAATHGASPIEVPLDGAFDLDVPRTEAAVRESGARLVFLCSPNNPTGNRLSRDRVLRLAEGCGAVVAVDEAYVEFGDAPAADGGGGDGSLAPLAGVVERLVVLRTLSKAWGLAGARVGCLVGAPGLIREVAKVGLPYPLSRPAMRAAVLALAREPVMRDRVRSLVAERERVRRRLAGLGLPVLPSDANFLLFFVPDASAVRRALAEEHGVVVRDRSELPRLAGGLRVTVGSPEENDRFLRGLEACLGIRPPVGGAGDPRATAPRTGEAERGTWETRVRVRVDLDGRGEARVATGIGFLDHMLDTLARHACIDLDLEAAGDLRVDEHHTVEDVGLVLGRALSAALGERRGIRRYGFLLPMDETLARVAVDLGGRPFLVFEAEFARERVGDLPTELVEEFLRALSNALGANLHVRVEYGRNDHHRIEAIFKALGHALRAAVERDPRLETEIPSTKGVL